MLALSFGFLLSLGLPPPSGWSVFEAVVCGVLALCYVCMNVCMTSDRFAGMVLLMIAEGGLRVLGGCV